MIGTGWPLPNQLQGEPERRPGGKFICAPRVNADPRAERLRLEVSEADYAKIGKGPSWNGTEVDLTDLATGRVVRIVGAACEFPTCFCDAVVVGSRADS